LIPSSWFVCFFKNNRGETDKGEKKVGFRSLLLIQIRMISEAQSEMRKPQNKKQTNQKYY
jgi:hypothetical protein